MAGSRTLKLSILAETKDLIDGLNKAGNETQSFGDKATKFGKVAGAAFAAAGIAAAAYAGKLLVDGVKAAIEDEAAQIRLATALENVTGATSKQIKAVEDQILKTSLLTGVSDDKLRPSLDRLVRSTQNVQKAQELQNLALDIAAGTGKDLQAVSEALAKAHDGNFTALKKLGGGIDESILKSKNFDAATAALAATFEGQASKQADTFAGKMSVLKVAFDEGKETIGAFILDAITPIVTVIVDKVVPAVQSFIDGMGGKEGLGQTFQDVSDFAKKFFTPVIDGLKSAFDRIKKVVMDNKDEFVTLFEFLKKYVAPFMGTVLKLAIEGIGIAIEGVINFVASLVRGFEKIIELGRKVKEVLGFGSSASSSSSGTSSSNLPASPSFGVLPDMPQKSQGKVTNINLTVNGAIDKIGTARSIIEALNNEATANGTFANIGTSLLVAR